MNMKSKVLVIVLVVALFLSLAGCGTSKPPTIDPENTAPVTGQSGATEPDGKITLGVTGNVTGYDPSSGEAVKNTVAIMMDQVNSSGGLLGKELAIVVEDDAGSAEDAVNAVSKMLENKDIVMIGGLYYSTCALAVDSIVRDGGKPVIVSGSTPAISDLNNPWMFRLRTNDIIQTTCAMEYLVDLAKPETVGAIYTTDSYSYSGAQVAEEYFKEKNIPFLMDGGSVGDTDFTAQILKMRNAGCEALFLNLNSAEMVVVCRQMHELGYKPTIMAGMCASNSDFIDLVEPEEVAGWYTFSEISFDSDVEGCQEFLNAYEARYGTRNPESAAIIVYGQLQLMLDAIKRAGSTDPEAIQQALEATKEVQVITGLLTCDEKHDLPGCTFIKEINMDKVEEVRGLYIGYERQY
jgi:branched-chain amino acid transport system substrate-binding protein